MNGADKPGQITLSVIIVTGFFGVLYYLMALRTALPQESRELVAGMIGVLMAKFGTVCDFWYSNNIGSQRTKELLARAQPIKIEEECVEELDKKNGAQR